MNLFKIAFKLVRNNSKLIYKGFGFKHLSDGTQYYVHPDNQSYNGTTTLCQPIGEAMILFSSMLSSIINADKEEPKVAEKAACDRQEPFGDYWVSPAKDEYCLELDVPEDWRENKVLESGLYSYRAYLKGEKLTVAAYDKNGGLIAGTMEHLHPLYKLLPAFMVLIARELERNHQYRAIMEKFLDYPEPDTFVNLNEDLYQMHKADDYTLSYGEVPSIAFNPNRDKKQLLCDYLNDFCPEFRQEVINRFPLVYHNYKEGEIIDRSLIDLTYDKSVTDFPGGILD